MNDIKEKINEMIKINKDAIQCIKWNIRDCGKCDNGYISQKHKLFNIDIKALHDCCFINGYSIDHFNSQIYKCHNALQELETNIPKVLKDFVNIDLFGEIKNFFDDTKQLLWIEGGIGTGKTTLMYAFYLESILRGIDFKFVNESNINIEFGKVKKPFDFNIFNAIDDVGVINDKALERFYFSLIDAKYLNGTKLLITSNLSIKDFIDKFTDKGLGFRVFDRILSMKRVIKLEGKKR